MSINKKRVAPEARSSSSQPPGCLGCRRGELGRGAADGTHIGSLHHGLQGAGPGSSPHLWGRGECCGVIQVLTTHGITGLGSRHALSSRLPALSLLTGSGHTGLLAAPLTRLALNSRWAFAPAAPSALNTLPLGDHWAGPDSVQRHVRSEDHTPRRYQSIPPSGLPNPLPFSP